MDDFLTVPQAAQRGRVVPGTVYRWLAEGRLTKYKNGAGRVFVDPAELDRLTEIKPVTVTVSAASPVVTGAAS